jgi:large repetitive protein
MLQPRSAALFCGLCAVLCLSAARAATITSPLTATGTVGVPFAYLITSDSADPAYNAAGLPPGLSLGNTGLITGTPTVAGTTTMVVFQGTAAANVTLTIHATETRTLAIIGPTAVDAVVGQAFAYAISVQPEGGNITFGATGLPDGLTSNAELISGSPTDAGTFTVSLFASSDVYGSTSAPLTITVAAGPPALTIIGPTRADAVVGQAFTYAIVTQPGAESFSATGLPDGLTLGDNTAGLISGTPTAAGAWFRAH